VRYRRSSSASNSPRRFAERAFLLIFRRCVDLGNSNDLSRISALYDPQGIILPHVEVMS
jgi:hypothetical protein